ncbi:uncharacterized protein LOC127799886 [Diospyros lotus]|uniref:uncharacterized protein LOC127799886 n=1 Tax=Diospyros lotus TaxID=55363 RepID=UPI00224C7D17|nr:uncharacterized protein LOC127799886 [Diospyros lotus]
MVKAVVGEETQLKSTEDRLSQSAVPSQVGLLIGKLSSSSDRCLVFDLIPTPPNDAGEAACSLLEGRGGRDDKKRGSKPKSQSDSSSLVIDKDWVAEHARQVSRMLLGGMKVLGIYIWTNESSFKNSTIILCQTVKGVAEAAPLLETDWDERLLIHISYSPRRWTCRNCSLTSNITSSSIRPCDFKMGRVLASLQTFRCTYTFDLRLPICCEDVSSARKFADILRQGISSHAKELKDAKAIIDGDLVVKDESCLPDGLHEVEFLLPFMKDSFAEACSEKEVVGVLAFSGSVCSFAYSNSREPVSQALADLKGDIIMSLQSRLDVICDESDGESSSNTNRGKDASEELSTGEPFVQLTPQLLRKQCSLTFPRRVFIPWLAGTYICDHLQLAETLEVVKDHCVELMAMPAPDSSTILEPEIVPPALNSKSLWDAALPFCLTSSPDCSSLEKSGILTSQEHEGKSTSSANFNLSAAVWILILAILIGLALYTVKRFSHTT